VKKHGRTWNELATVSIMSASQGDATMVLARRILDAVAAGDQGEALRLVRELERVLAKAAESPADAAPSFDAQPAVVPMAHAPSPARSARQVVAGALAEIGGAGRAGAGRVPAAARLSKHAHQGEDR